MKVACEGCGARYSVPEDKIQGAGRTFKVICRECGQPIMIQGVGDEVAAKWYFAVERDRRGPVDAATLAAHLADGTITEENLAWCQGMGGWEPLSTIEALKEELDRLDEEPHDISNDTTMVSRDEIEAAHAALQAADAEAEARAEPLTSESSTSSMLDALIDPSNSLEASTPLHERADTSVLFSLDDLTSASKNPLPGVTLPSGASGDQSGLIDVQATRNRSGNRRRPLTQSPFEDGPAPVSRPVDSGTATISVPVIKRRSNPLPMIIGALLLLGGGAFAAMHFMANDPPDKAPPSVVAKAPAPAPAPAAPAAKVEGAQPAAKAPKASEEAPPKAAAQPASPAKAEAPEAAEPPPAEAPEKVAAEEAKEMTPAERRRQRRLERRERRRKEREARRQGKSPSSAEAKPTPTPAPAKPSPPPAKAEPPKAAAAPPSPPSVTPKKAAENNKSATALLAALNKNKAKESGGAANAQAAGLPQKLSSSKLRSTLRRKRGTFANCYKKMAERPPGGITVKTALVVAGSGSVKSVRITSGGGASAGVLRCISGALKSTKFPPFAASQMSVNYPISLR